MRYRSLATARLRELNSFRYGSLLFHVEHSPLLAGWQEIFCFLDDVHAEAVPRLARERILDLNTPNRRAALIDRRHDRCGRFVREAIDQILIDLYYKIVRYHTKFI